MSHDGHPRAGAVLLRDIDVPLLDKTSTIAFDNHTAHAFEMAEAACRAIPVDVAPPS